MAKKKYPHSAQDFLNIGEDAPPTRQQDASLDRIANAAAETVNSEAGPPNPNVPDQPAFPNWMRMSTEKRLMAVIKNAEKDPTFENTVGAENTTKFEKRVRERHAIISKRNP
jgi:hypothetical protein